MKLLPNTTSYFRGVATELRKVVWPTFPQLMRYLVTVVVGIGLAMLFIFAVDYIFFHALAFIIK